MLVVQRESGDCGVGGHERNDRILERKEWVSHSYRNCVGPITQSLLYVGMDRYEFPDTVAFEFKSDTDLYEFAKVRTLLL